MFSFFKKKYKSIDVDTFREMKKMRDTVILDVRTRAEQQGGVINGQRNMNVMDPMFKDQAAKLDKSKTYLVYCRSGARSARACSILGKLGFEQVYNLRGGYMAWERQN
ncbi:MAG: rhodanese-like domain-containing protein [Cyclobacteriaceae bacterium]|nr:rhodanese-like domain-containing protein [Cyclobacteriaceae bacterium]